MTCNHFLVADPGGRITGWEGGGAVCCECGLLTNVPAEIEAARAEGRYVDVDHPDYADMFIEADLVCVRKIRPWLDRGTCEPISDPLVEVEVAESQVAEPGVTALNCSGKVPDMLRGLLRSARDQAGRGGYRPSSEIISPYPRNLLKAVINSPLFRTVESEIYEAWKLFAVLEILPYNTPVERHGRTYHLIRDAHGGVFLTQDGVILGGANLSEGANAAHA